MVEISGNPGYQHGFNNWILFFSGVLMLSVIGFFAYKLVASLQEKERKVQEKKKLKEMKNKKK